MITREDVVRFYHKYKQNLKKEEHITADLMEVSSQEEWVEKLKQKYHIMRQLYIENEALLNMCIRPLIEGRAELTEDVAEEFVNQIRLAHQEGFEDNLAMMEMAETLAEYLKEHGSIECYIWDLSLLGIFYNSSSEKEEGRKGYEYFKQVCALEDRYFEIEDFETRKRIIYAFYNRPILQVNFLLEEEGELQWNLDEALRFYHDPKVLALDGERFDFAGLIEELNYDVFGNYIMSHTRENSKRWMLERAEKVLGDYYNEKLIAEPNPYEMPDEIYCYYKRTLFFLGKISCTEFLDDYKKYCDYSIANDKLEHTDGFWESRLFQVAVNHLPGILQCLLLYGDEYQGDPLLRSKCVEAYLQIIRQLPRTGNSRFVNDVICRSLYGFMERLAVGDVESDILINVMINRDEITLIHSEMVSQIAGLLLDAVLESRPELLIGILDCKTVVEVLEKREQIAAFVSQAARLFDVGKLKDADIVNKQSRQLTVKEKERIYMHPAAGAEIVKKIPALAQFGDVVRGHHKSWDGTMGYPEEVDNTTSKDRFLIELIHVSDCLDAATDFIGRSYRAQKTLKNCMEEFVQGKGTLYSPELIEVMETDQNLLAELEYLLSEGRIRTYYEVYGIAVEDSQKSSDKLMENRMEDDGWDTGQDEKEQLISILHESNRENHAFVNAMVRQSLLTLFVDMRSGRYHVVSLGEEKLFGKLTDGKYQDFLMHYLEKAALPEDWEKMSYQLNLAELTHTLVRQGGNYEYEMRVNIGDEYRWMRIQFVKMDEQNVIPRTMAMIITDIHESHSRSDQMEAALKDAYHAAMEANQTKSLFLSSMSHDIRTPMNGIMGMTQIAMQHLDDRERIEDCLRKIDESSQHLMELINEVLDMSRIESGKTILHTEPLRLQELLNGVIDVCRAGAAKAELDIVVEIDELSNDWVMGDPVRLRQIFSNILSNAVKYTPEHGCIQVRARKLSEDRKDGNCYQFEIEDNGIGMSEEFQKRLFESFVREDNSMTNVTQGTGLGLSIARSMLTMMGGTIEVDSTQGVGTTFTITIQLPQADQTAVDVPEEQEEWNLAGHRILLAEDNELNREIACELLEEKGLVVETAQNGEEAYESLKHSEDGYYELILMDIRMPKMDGYEAARAIRKLPGEYAHKIPIIALTANIFQDDIIKAMESGMNEHVTKPIDMQKIGKVLNRWLNR